MNLKSNKGFSLIEMMVTVGIIGILALIAIPNFQRFQGKAKQANAKTELASIYGMQKAFQTEFGSYHSNLHLVGYTPDGYPVSGTCPGTASSTSGQTRYYTTGSVTRTVVDSTPIQGLSTPTCLAVYTYGSTVGATLNETKGGATKVTTTEFILQSAGKVGGSVDDIWTIDDKKNLVNKQIGY